MAKGSSFDEVREFVRCLNLRNDTEWYTWSRSSERPEHVPLNPEKSYANEWVSWPDFLGTTKEVIRARRYRTFDEARIYVHELRLKNHKEFENWCHSGDRPSDIPSGPQKIYRLSGWRSWGDFLGTIDRGVEVKSERPDTKTKD